MIAEDVALLVVGGPTHTFGLSRSTRQKDAATSVIDSAVVNGRGSVRVAGITFLARFRFTHLAGQGYRHSIEATLFGLPAMRVNETSLDGQARLELPFGVT